MTDRTQGPPINPYAPPAYMIGPPVSPVPRGADPNLAPRGARLAARIVDNLLFVSCLIPAGFGLASHRRDYLGLGASSLMGIALVAVQSYLVTTRGQSIAKILLGLRVVRTDGSPVGFVTGVAIREWVIFGIGVIPGLGLLFRFADSVTIFGDECRCLHDLMAGTKVLTVTKPPV